MAKFKDIRESLGTASTITFQKDTYMDKENKEVTVAKAWDNANRIRYVLPLDIFEQAKANPNLELIHMVTDRTSKESNQPYKDVFCFVPKDSIGSL
jgi:hypothetical protein